MSWKFRVFGIVTAMLTAQTAYANKFDLECTAVDEAGLPKFGAATAHYQIDLDAGRWCRDECTFDDPIKSISGYSIVLRAVTRTSVLSEGASSIDKETIEYQMDTNVLTIAWVPDLNRGGRLLCSKDIFGGLRPYLQGGPKPIGYINFSEKDFLKTKKRKKLGGDVGIELTVSATGTPIKCEVIFSSTNSELDAHSCNLAIERLRFIPATNRQGHAVEGKYRKRVRWIPNARYD